MNLRISEKTAFYWQGLNAFLCIENGKISTMYEGLKIEILEKNYNRAARKIADEILNLKIKSNQFFNSKTYTMQKVTFTVPAPLVNRVEQVIFKKFESLKKDGLFFRKKDSEKGKNLVEFEVAMNYNHDIFLLGKIFGEEISAQEMKEHWEESQK